MFSLSRFCLVSAVVGFSCPNVVVSQELNSTSPVSALIAGLGHSSFDIREQASQLILDRGPALIADLKSLPAGQSKEARNRAAQLLKILEEESLREISQQFLLDSNISNSHGLPGWRAFSGLVGGGRNSKLLFLQLLKSHSDIAVLIDELESSRDQLKSSEELATKLAHHCAVRSNQLLEKFHRLGGLELVDAVVMLFAASSMEGTVPFEVSELIRSMSRQEFAGSLNRPSVKPVLLELLGRWVPKSPDSMAQEVMHLARKLELKQVLPISRRHISKSFDPFTREQAIMCLAKFGDSSDVSELLKYANDTTVIQSYTVMSNENDNDIVESLGAPPGTIPSADSAPLPVQKLVRVSDIAVATAMILADEDPQQLFPSFTPENFVIRPRAIVAVLESEQKSRDEAIHTWLAQRVSSADSKPRLSPELTPTPDSVP